MFSLSVLWALPCSSGPGPGLLADLSSPVPPLGPLVYCLLECVSEFIKFNGRRGEHPLTGCALFVVLQLPSKSVDFFAGKYSLGDHPDVFDPNSISLDSFGHYR